MKTYRLVLIAAGLFGAASITACDYAKESDLAALRAEHAATRDTLAALWEWTGNAIGALAAIDTVPPPPKCPPYCWQVEVLGRPMPPAPERSGSP